MPVRRPRAGSRPRSISPRPSSACRRTRASSAWPRPRSEGDAVRAVVQRVSRAEVRVEGRTVARIQPGLVVLLGVLRGDDEDTARRLAHKLAHWRCFADEDGRMNRSLLESGGSALVVSQVTLAADGKKGRRPSLDLAAPPELARALYE